MTTDERYSTPPSRRRCTSPPCIGRFIHSEYYHEGNRKHFVLPQCLFDEEIINLNRPLSLSATSDTLSQYQYVCDYWIPLPSSFDHAVQGKKRSISEVATSEMGGTEVDSTGSTDSKSKYKKNN